MFVLTTTLTKLNITNSNRIAVQMENDPSIRTKDAGVLVDHVVISKAGEHAMALSADKAIVSNNSFTDCAPYGSCCYLTPAYPRQQEISNNVFRGFAGGGICREATGNIYPTNVENLVISGNTIQR